MGTLRFLSFSWIFLDFLEREKHVATVFRLLIVTHQSSAHFDVLSRASCILTFAVSVDFALVHIAKSSACRARLVCVDSPLVISLM